MGYFLNKLRPLRPVRGPFIVKLTYWISQVFHISLYLAAGALVYRTVGPRLTSRKFSSQQSFHTRRSSKGKPPIGLFACYGKLECQEWTALPLQAQPFRGFGKGEALAIHFEGKPIGQL